MQINLRQLSILPCILMMVIAMQASFDFTAIKMQMASYVALAIMILGAMFSFMLIAYQKTISLIDLLVIFFVSFILLSSVSHATDFKNWFYQCLSICCVYFAFNFYRERLHPLIIGLALGFSIGIFLQLYQLIIQPEIWMIPGKRELSSYLLGGNYNQMGMRLLLALIFDILCIKISRWFYFLLLPCILLSIAIPLMVGSMTATTCIILFLILCAIPNHRMRLLGISGILVAVSLFQVFVCFNGKGIEDNELMVWFIEDVLGKDITFTYRTYMWDSALQVISQSPIIGHGFPSKEWYLVNMSSLAIGPHNIILAILIYGGVVGFILYMFFLFRSFLILQAIRDYWADVIIVGIAVACVMMLMEVYPVNLIFMLFAIAEYYPIFREQQSNE